MCVCVRVCVCVYTLPVLSLHSRHEDYVTGDPLLGDREVWNVFCALMTVSYTQASHPSVPVNMTLGVSCVVEA